MKAVHVLIHGRVQGVGFRAWMEWNAEELGLSGWVRNRRDGTVEAVLSGAVDAVDDMLARCRTGPRGAAVSEVQVIGEGGVHSGFQVRPDA